MGWVRQSYESFTPTLPHRRSIRPKNWEIHWDRFSVEKKVGIGGVVMLFLQSDPLMRCGKTDVVGSK